MSRFQKYIVKLIAGFLFASVIPVAHAGIAIIVNPAVKEIGLTKEKVVDIYLGRKKSYSDGTRIEPVDQMEDSAVRNKFYQSVIKKSTSEVNRYWAKLKFTGKGKPPKVVAGDEAVVNYVATHPGAIGYIDGKYLNNSVKVVLIIP